MERKVVDLVAEGFTKPQIGDRLYISARTGRVHSHLAHVFAKLHIASRAVLAAAAAVRSLGTEGNE